MADPRFFRRTGPFRLADLADQCGGELATGVDPDAEIVDVAPLSTAGPDEISFFDNLRYKAEVNASKAGACIMQPENTVHAPKTMACVLSQDPYRAFALVAGRFYPDTAPAAGVDASATVSDSAVLGDGSKVCAGAVIGAEAKIGARCQIGANAVIGDAVIVGDDTIIGANAVLSHCAIGARVVIGPGVCVGQPGFGYVIDPGGHHLAVPQLGRVIVEDGVEIGANCAIDRGSGPDTVIGAGTVIDNLVHVAHNVQIGRGCVIAGQSGISGSTRLGDLVVMAGQTGLAGHIKIGSGVQIGGQSGVLSDVPPGLRVMGTPAKPVREFFREVAVLSRLAGKRKRT
ncbi:MAG: UDP-3-O-(3-hydroxymyristoyl)glucosamine N-acyltransferase [Rhodospirillales bacterium]|nr:MAG: UDP-3-O-(3-hydroxymyristoyl)glucosamine N-acyltransferase [Rhodospirillales bacterium]